MRIRREVIKYRRRNRRPDEAVEDEGEHAERVDEPAVGEGGVVGDDDLGEELEAGCAAGRREVSIMDTARYE